MKNGVFSNPSGKIGGVVFGKWKSVDYGRSYTIPSNPNSPAQQTQRTKMTDCVSFARNLVAPIFNKLYDPFERDRSAYNTFVSKNIAKFVTNPVFSDMELGSGLLYPAEFDGTPVYNPGTSEIQSDFITVNGYNGLPTDLVTAVAYNVRTGQFDFAYDYALRSAGEVNVTLTNEEVGDTIVVYLIAYREVNGVVTMVSSSKASSGTVTA